MIKKLAIIDRNPKSLIVDIKLDVQISKSKLHHTVLLPLPSSHPQFALPFPHSLLTNLHTPYSVPIPPSPGTQFRSLDSHSARFLLLTFLPSHFAPPHLHSLWLRSRSPITYPIPQLPHPTSSLIPPLPLFSALAPLSPTTNPPHLHTSLDIRHFSAPLQSHFHFSLTALTPNSRH